MTKGVQIIGTQPGEVFLSFGTLTSPEGDVDDLMATTEPSLYAIVRISGFRRYLVGHTVWDGGKYVPTYYRIHAPLP